mmetsp:Transcript_22230/g.48497  ORF Transcript_22230/g.48497 Transcript_22230/m.48497 type:complete len:442 (-) Transcript_22230:310-1635(-)
MSHLTRVCQSPQPRSVRGASEAGLEGLVEHLAQRRVRVRRHGELVERHAVLNRVGALLDQVGRVQTDDVNRDELVRVLAEDHLGDAIAGALCERLGIGLEVSCGDADLVALLLGALARNLLGRTDHGHLRVGEAGSGHGVVVEHVLVATHVLHRGDALRARRVREHHLAVEVADAPEALNRLALSVESAHLLVHLHEAAVHPDTERLEPQALREGHAARADHHGVNLDRGGGLLGLGVDHLHDARLDAGFAWDHLGSEDICVRVDRARPDQQPVGQLRDLLVEARHHLGHRLDEGHLGAKRRVHVGKLEADVARADDRDPVGHPLELEGLVRGEDRLAIHLDAGRHEGHRARRQDDVLGADRLVGANQLHRGWRNELALVREDGDAQRSERALQVALHLVGQVVRVRGHLGAVVRHLARLDAQLGQVLRVAHLAHAARRGE